METVNSRESNITSPLPGGRQWTLKALLFCDVGRGHLIPTQKGGWEEKKAPQAQQLRNISPPLKLGQVQETRGKALPCSF